MTAPDCFVLDPDIEVRDFYRRGFCVRRKTRRSGLPRRTHAGQHVGEDTMRRRARRIQDLMQTVGPLAGVVATAAGSVYTGLKGMFGP
ncbi:MAG TPA: hypothetical protein VGD96_02515 [Bradyrhizobium sp.]